MLELVVAKDGSGDFDNIQEALNPIPYNTEATIYVCEGIYKEKLFSDKKDLSIIARGNVIVINFDFAREIMPDGLKRGTFRTYTAFFSGEKLYLENIAFYNASGSGNDVGQALALYLDVENAHLKNVTLKANQDTLFISPLPDEEREKRGFYGPRCFTERKLSTLLYEGGYISGSIDFIFGGGDALFKNVEIESVDEGYVAAPSGKKEGKGFLFDSCKFTSHIDKEEFVYLMRPWRDEGKAIFRNCTFGKHIHKSGISPWHGREDKAYLSTFSMENCTFLQ